MWQQSISEGGDRKTDVLLKFCECWTTAGRVWFLERSACAHVQVAWACCSGNAPCVLRPETSWPGVMLCQCFIASSTDICSILLDAARNKMSGSFCIHLACLVIVQLQKIWIVLTLKIFFVFYWPHQIIMKRLIDYNFWMPQSYSMSKLSYKTYFW